jgi:glucose-6-phosphate 1-dehydrogenase
MIQNHATQVMALVGMSEPVAYEASAVRNEKVKILRALSPLLLEDVVFGQYAAGQIDGKDVVGYHDEDGIPEGSKTETYVAVRLMINSWRWLGVPFYIRCGKRLPRKLTQIDIVFRRPPVTLFHSFGLCHIHTNMLQIRIQPEEGFSLSFDIKTPGEGMEVQTEPLRFNYHEAFGDLPEAYETLIKAMLDGDQTQFVRADEVEHSWELYSPILERKPKVQPYAAGTWGPKAASDLLNKHGHSWVVF